MEKSAPEEVPKLAIKKETVNDDIIKEFAETAMNELLGWYGYGNSNQRNELACRSYSGSNSSGPESPKFNESCGWCGKTVDENTGLSSAAATFCSELCFSQSRRANFKKNKTCDWCKHVRHTVSFVDSQDGLSQLQFCSDKCLNQYKMHIFWRETRAHLDIHPHIHGEESSGTLITPDLWLKKCKSPENLNSSSSSSPKLGENSQQISPLPLITVAHPSKLMSIPLNDLELRRQRTKIQKKGKNRNITLPSCSNISKPFITEMPQDLRIKHTPADFENPKLKANDRKVNESNVSETNLRVEPRVNDMTYHFEDRQTAHRKLLDSLVPPPTILVPYPILLPIPIPIPIPLPVPNNFFNKNCTIDRKSGVDVFSQTDEVDVSCQNVNNVETGEKINVRPLRKRKRITENCKVVTKSKKVLSKI